MKKYDESKRGMTLVPASHLIVSVVHLCTVIWAWLDVDKALLVYLWCK